MTYEPVIGIEVHAELSTASKVYCACPTSFGAPPNTQVCPVCLGLPGALPVINRRCVEFTIRAALALNCEIAAETKFDRKQYHYADLPKGYQISQYDQPIGRNGWLEIDTPDGPKRIGIRRVHLEEDTGKLAHQDDGTSLVDFNRSGVGLIEIVSEPDIRSAEEAKAYATKLRTILKYTGVSDVRMAEGSMRCELNLSLRPTGSTTFGTLTEVKNIGSFRGLARAAEFEIIRQTEVLASGGQVVRETRGWSEEKGQTVSQRTKEQAQDYRYFPDPDLVPLTIDRAWVDEVRATMPELPDAKRARLIADGGLPASDAGRIVSSQGLAAFFDGAVAAGADAKAVANWVTGELMRLLNADGIDTEELEANQLKTKPEGLAELLTLIGKGTISGKIAKTVFEEMYKTGKPAAQVISEQGLVQVSNEDELRAIAAKVLVDNPKPVADYRGGKVGVIGFLVGQMMKATRGRANPELAQRLIREELDK
jgi:aspartyl-tRNA(Asn)/glutamyl-tRNA(Gln) amidotransferase subunit B